MACMLQRDWNGKWEEVSRTAFWELVSGWSSSLTSLVVARRAFRGVRGSRLELCAYWLFYNLSDSSASRGCQYLLLHGTVVGISELRRPGHSRCSTAAMLQDRAPCLGTTLPEKLSHSQGACHQQKDLQDGLITHVCDFTGHHSHFSIICCIVSWGTPVTWASFRNPRKPFSDQHS